MIVEIVALLFAALTGWTLARRAGEAILLGIALAAGVLLLFSIAGVPWSFFGVGASMAAVAIAAILLRRTGFSPSMPSKGGGLKPALRFAALLDLAALIVLGGYALFATMAPLWEFDYIGDFGLKGRWFFEARAIDCD